MVTRNLNPGARRRTLSLLSLVLPLVFTGCGLGYVAVIYQATRDDSSRVIDQSQPDLIITNLQAPPVATLVAFDTDEDTGQTLEFFEPLSLSVLNSGDDVAPAGYSVDFYISKTKTITSQSIKFRSTQVKVTTLIGDFTRVSTDNTANIEAVVSNVKATIVAGPYFLLARVGGTTELDSANNDLLGVGAVQIFDPRVNINDALPTEVPSQMAGRPNFVIESVTIPSFAFAQDAVNANQQPVAGDRLVNLNIEVALRSAAITVQEDFQVRFFLSTDALSTDDDLELKAPIPAGQSMAPPITFSFPPSPIDQIRQFSNFAVLMPKIADIAVTLPQTFFVLASIVPQGAQGQGTQEIQADNYDNVRASDIRTRLYSRFLQSDKAILPDLTVDGLTRTDPDALEFTTTAFSIPTPGSQRIFSFQIPDAENINPDESQVLILLESNDFDPTLNLLSPTASSIQLADDSFNGQSAFISQPLSATGEGNNIFYVVISSLSGTGSGNFNLTIFLQSRTDPNKPVVAPINLGNLLSLDRGQARVLGTASFPVALQENSTMTVRVDDDIDVPLTFASGNLIADLSQTTAAELVADIDRQVDSSRLTVGLDADGRLFLSSVLLGPASSITITDGTNSPAAILSLPIQESGISENTVTFNFQQSQEDTEFIFFMPNRGAYEFRVEPSLDLFGGVTASLQFFDGISQKSISLEKNSVDADRTTFRGPNNSPLVLDRGFYALVFNAPQPILNTNFRLTYKLRFDRSVNPQ
jgi:hypothetical protein